MIITSSPPHNIFPDHDRAHLTQGLCTDYNNPSNQDPRNIPFCFSLPIRFFPCSCPPAAFSPLYHVPGPPCPRLPRLFGDGLVPCPSFITVSVLCSNRNLPIRGTPHYCCQPRSVPRLVGVRAFPVSQTPRFVCEIDGLRVCFPCFLCSKERSRAMTRHLLQEICFTALKIILVSSWWSTRGCESPSWHVNLDANWSRFEVCMAYVSEVLEIPLRARQRW